MEVSTKAVTPRRPWLIRAAKILICVGLVSPLMVNIFLGVVTNYAEDDSEPEWTKTRHAAPHFERSDTIRGLEKQSRAKGGQMNSRKIRLRDENPAMSLLDAGDIDDDANTDKIEMAKQMVESDEFLIDLDAVSRKPCPEVIQYWLSQADIWNRVNDKPVSISASSPFLWFLHIPRTGGRCMHSCMLKYAKKPDERCLPSYDRFRVGMYNNCSLLGSHDDFSVSRLLNRERVDMMTMSRDPVDRVISAYEFAISNANSLRINKSDPRAIGVDEEALRETKTPPNDTISRRSTISTRLVWPWSKLIPLIERDVGERKARNFGRADNSDSDPYNSGHVMSMREFVTHPDVINLIHNGASLQTLGLTNYSHFDAPHTVRLRECATSDSAAAGLVAQAAKARMQQMTFVGLTSQHRRSAELLAATYNWSLQQDAYPMGPKTIYQSRKGDRPGFEASRPSIPLGEQYVMCAAKSLQKQNNRRNSPLKSIGAILFNSDARKAFMEKAMRPAGEFSESNPHAGLIDLIRSMNAADSALFDEGQRLFQLMEQRYAEEGRIVEVLPKDSDIAALNGSLTARKGSSGMGPGRGPIDKGLFEAWAKEHDIDYDRKLGRKEMWSFVQSHRVLVEKLGLPRNFDEDRAGFKKSFRSKFDTIWDENGDNFIGFDELQKLFSLFEIT